MIIRIATEDDLPFLEKNDRHIRLSEIRALVGQNRILLAEMDGVIVGWLRWGLFWDNTPFMNMLYFLEGYRGKGYGRQIVEHWETQMRQEGYDLVMTSSLSDEQAQHFYRKLGYVDSGSLLLPGEALEIIFTKSLR